MQKRLTDLNFRLSCMFRTVEQLRCAEQTPAHSTTENSTVSTIRAVDRAFAILRTVSHYPDGVGVTQLAGELSLAKSTISRLLTTMEHWEVVERTPENKFRIGQEAARWLGHVPASRSLRSLIRPILTQISAETEEAVALCLREGYQVVYLDHVQSNQDIQVRDWSGERLPLHVTSSGKVLLTYATDEFKAAFLARPLQAFTSKTVVDSAELSTQLKTIQTQGYDIADGEHAEGITGISVPLFDAAQTIVGAVNVYGPSFRMDSAETQQAIVKIMQSAVAQLTI